VRRTFFGLFALFAFFGLLATSCQHSGALRVVSINNGKEVQSDLVDFGIYRDPTDPEAEPELISVTPEDIIPIELQYVEIGPGLPTWTPYQANITRAQISFDKKLGELQGNPDPVNVVVNWAVPADPTGKKTVTAYLTICPALWKEQWFGDEAANDPSELNAVGTYSARVRLTGIDDASGATVTAEGTVLVTFGNFFDDESRIGQ